MKLSDLSTSISEMSDEEAYDLVIERRKVRREDYQSSNSSSSSSKKKKKKKTPAQKLKENLSEMSDSEKRQFKKMLKDS